MAKVKIPKKVAGMKIPKKVRRKAKKAVRMAESPVVREFAAAALGAAAQGKAVKAEIRARSDGAGGFSKTTVRIDGERLAGAIRAAALDGLRRFLEGFEEGLRDATSAAADEGENETSRSGESGRPSGRSADAAAD